MMVSAALEVVDLGTPPTLLPALAREVDQLWQRRCSEDPGLHDGDIFSVASATPERVTGWFVPYRRFVAQRTDASIVADLGVAPLAVTGRTVTSDRFLIVARRGQRVTQDPGTWELAPAGGVDRSARRPNGRVDLGVALRGELGDELGLVDDDVVVVTPVALVIDPGERVHDVVLDVRLRIDAATVVGRFAERRTDEYDEVRLVPVVELPGALAAEARAAGFDEIAALPFHA